MPVDFIFFSSRLELTTGLLVAGFLALELGFRIGRKALHPNSQFDEAFRAVASAILSLTAFLLAFSFSFAASRYEARRDLNEKEATAISTACLRATLIKTPTGARLVAQFSPYVQSRLELYQCEANPGEALQLWQKSRDIQSRMWTLAGDLTRADPTNRRCDLLLTALNAMFDAGDDQLDARANRIPPAVYVLLFTAVLLSAVMIGHLFGRAGKRSAVAWVLFTVLTSLVVFMVLDLDRAQRGLVITNLRPLEIVQHDIR